MDRDSADLTAPQGGPDSKGGSARPTGSGFRFSSRLFGYDTFVSFALGPSPRGTQSYASDLARQLRERDFRVFFSEDEAAPGEQLDSTLVEALLRAKILVVIANRGTLQEPRWVRKEVEEFRQHHPDRPVIPINVDGALQEPALAESAQEWLDFQDKIWLDESAAAVAAGIASHEVVERLATAPTRARSNVKWRWVVRSVIALLAALALGLGIAAKLARDNAKKAIRQSRIALSRQLAAQSMAELPHDRETGLLLALKAEGEVRTYQAVEAVADAIQAYPRRIALRGSTGQLWDAAFSPDGRRVVTISRGVHVWAADTGEHLAELGGYQDAVFKVSFSPDGALILGAGNSGWIWNTMKLEPVGSDLNRVGGVSDARFGPSGNLIVAGNDDGTVSVWESHTGRRVVEMHGHAGRVTGVAFSPDEASIVTAGDDGVARIWSIPSGDLMGELIGHTHRLISAEFSPDGRYILTAAAPFPINSEIASEENRGVVTGGSLAGGRRFGTPEPDNTARIWDSATGQMMTTLRSHSSGVARAAFAPDGQAVAVVSSADTRFYDLAGGPIDGFAGKLASFSLDGRLLVAIELDETVRVRRTDSYDSAGVFPGQFALLSPKGTRILTSGPDGSTYIWDMDRDRLAAGLRQSGVELFTVSFSSDGAVAATIDRYGEARLWDGASGDEITSTEAPDLSGQVTRQAFFADGTDTLLTLGGDGQLLLRHLASRASVRLDTLWRIAQAILNPDGSRVLTQYQDEAGSPACKLRLWSSDTGRMLAEICSTGSESYDSVRFSTDGAWIEIHTASGCQIWDGHEGGHVADFPGAESISGSNRSWVATAEVEDSIPIWEARTGRPAGTLEPYAPRASRTPDVETVFSPDGSLVMTLGEPFRVWDLATREKLAEFDGTHAVFSPDGLTVASINTSRNDTAAHLWEARTGKSLATVSHAPEVVKNVAFSPNGKWLITTSREMNVWIREASTGRVLRQLISSEKVLSARLAPGANWLVLTIEDGIELYPWERFAPADDLIRRARTLVLRSLHPQELGRFGQI